MGFGRFDFDGFSDLYLTDEQKQQNAEDDAKAAVPYFAKKDIISGAVDGDTFNTEEYAEQALRLDGVNTAESTDLGLDKLAQNETAFTASKKFYAQKYGVPYETVTLANIKSEGLEAKKKSLSFLGGEGAEVFTNQTGTDVYGRPIVEMYNKEGESLSDELNNKSDNYGYFDKYNEEKLADEVYGKEQEVDRTTGFNAEGAPEAQISPNGLYSYGGHKNLNEQQLERYRDSIDAEVAYQDSWKAKLGGGIVGSIADVPAKLYAGTGMVKDFYAKLVESNVRRAPGATLDAMWENYNSVTSSVKWGKHAGQQITDADKAMYHKVMESEGDMTPEQAEFMESKKGKNMLSMGLQYKDKLAAYKEIDDHAAERSTIVDRRKTKVVERNFRDAAKNEGLASAFKYALTETPYFASEMIESLPFMAALASGVTTLPTMYAMIESGTVDAVTEFTALNERAPDAEELGTIKLWKTFGALVEKFGASRALGPEAKFVKKALENSGALSKPLRFLVKVGEGSVSEGISGGGSVFGDEMAVKQDIDKVDSTEVALGAAREMIGAAGITGASTAKRAIGSVTKKKKLTPEQTMESDAKRGSQLLGWIEGGKDKKGKARAELNGLIRKLEGIDTPEAKEALKGLGDIQEVKTGSKAETAGTDVPAERVKATGIQTPEGTPMSKKTSELLNDPEEGLMGALTHTKDVIEGGGSLADRAVAVNDMLLVLNGIKNSEGTEGIVDYAAEIIRDNAKDVMDASTEMTQKAENAKDVFGKAFSSLGEAGLGVDTVKELEESGLVTESEAKLLTDISNAAMDAGGKSKETSEEIFNDKAKGSIKSYVAESLTEGKVVSGFKRFSSHMSKKAAAMRTALTAAEGDGKPRYTPHGQSSYEVLTGEQMEEMGAKAASPIGGIAMYEKFSMVSGSKKSSVEIVEKEAKAIEGFIKATEVLVTAKSRSEHQGLAAASLSSFIASSGMADTNRKTDETTAQKDLDAAHVFLGAGKKGGKKKEEQQAGQAEAEAEEGSKKPTTTDTAKEEFTFEGKTPFEAKAALEEMSVEERNEAIKGMTNKKLQGMSWPEGTVGSQVKVLWKYIGGERSWLDRISDKAVEFNAAVKGKMTDVIGVGSKAAERISLVNMMGREFTGADIIEKGMSLLEGTDVAKKKEKLKALAAMFEQFKLAGQSYMDQNEDNRPLSYSINNLLVDGKIPDHITYAMASSFLAWVNAGGNDTKHNSDQDIGMMLYSEMNKRIDRQERRALRKAGTPGFAVAPSAGQNIGAILGMELKDLSEVKRAAFGDITDMTGYNNMMGLIMVELSDHVLNNGEKVVNFNRGQFNLGKESDYGMARGEVQKDGSHVVPLKMLKLNDTKGNQKLIDTFKKSVKFFDVLNGTEMEVHKTLEAPAKGVQQAIRNSFSKIPKNRKDVLEKLQGAAWTPLQDNVKAFLALSDQAQKDMLEIIDTSKISVDKREDAESYNNMMLDSIQSLKDLAGDGNSDPFFFKYGLMSQYRMMIMSSGVNPLTNKKLHRFMIGLEGGAVTFAKDDAASENVEAMFKYSIVQALGGDIDKVGHAEVMADFDATAAEYEKLAKAYGTDGFTAMLEASDVNGVHGLAGVIALNSWFSEGDVTTTLGLEVDGITNGYALGLMQFATPDSPAFWDNVRKVGITKAVGEYEATLSGRSKGENDFKDAYVESADELRKVMGDKGYAELFEAVTTVPGSKPGKGGFSRNMMKTPFMVFNYGASAYTAAKGLIESGYDVGILDVFYKRVADGSLDKEYFDNLEALIRMSESSDPNKAEQSARDTATGLEAVSAIKAALRKENPANHKNIELEAPVDQLREMLNSRFYEDVEEAFAPMIQDTEAIKKTLTEAMDATASAFAIEWDQRKKMMLGEIQSKAGTHGDGKLPLNTEQRRGEQRRLVLSVKEERDAAEKIIYSHFPMLRGAWNSSKIDNGQFLDMVKRKRVGANNSTGEKRVENNIYIDATEAELREWLGRQKGSKATNKKIADLFRAHGADVHHDTGKKYPSDNSNYSGAKFSPNVDSIVEKLKATNGGLFKVPTNAQQGLGRFEVESAGVSMLVGSVQNLDSTIMAKTISEYQGDFLGIHDAVMVPIDRIEEVTDLMNENTESINKDYSIAEEVLAQYGKIEKSVKATVRTDRLLEKIRATGKSGQETYRLAHLVNSSEKAIRDNDRAIVGLKGAVETTNAREKDTVRIEDGVAAALGFDSYRQALHWLDNDLLVPATDVEEKANMAAWDKRYKASDSYEAKQGREKDDVVVVPPSEKLTALEVAVARQVKNRNKFFAELQEVRQYYKPNFVSKHAEKVEAATFEELTKKGRGNFRIIEGYSHLKFRESEVPGVWVAFNKRSEGLAVAIEINGEITFGSGINVNVKSEAAAIKRATAGAINESFQFNTAAVSKINNANPTSFGSLGSKRQDMSQGAISEEFIGSATSEDISRVNEQLGGKEANSDITRVLEEIVAPLMDKLGALRISLKGMKGVFAEGEYRTGDNTIEMVHNVDGPKSRTEQTPQEVFGHELIHAVGWKAAMLDHRYKAQLKRLRNQVAKFITVEDFLVDGDTSEHAKQMAEAQYQAVFGVDTLQEFLSYGLTNPTVIARLKAEKAVERGWFEGDTFYDRVLNTLGKAVEIIQETISRSSTDGKVKDKNAFEQLIGLTKEVNGITQGKTSTMAEMMESADGFYERSDDWLKETFNKNKPLARRIVSYATGKGFDLSMAVADVVDTEKADDLGKKNYIARKSVELAQSTTASVSNAMAAFHLFFDDEVMTTEKREAFIKDVTGMANDHVKDINNKAYSAVYNGLTKLFVRIPLEFQKVINRSAKDVEQARKAADELIKGIVESGFKKGEKPGKAERRMITKVVGKAGLSDLLGKYDAAEIAELVTNKEKLIGEIADVGKGLNLSKYWVQQVKGLSWRMVQQYQTTAVVFDNVHAMQANAPAGQRLSAKDLQRVDELISLVALKKTEGRDSLAGFLKRDPKGFKNVLGVFSQLQKNSLERAFGGKPMLMTKGYVAKLADPHKQIRVAPDTTESIKEMESLGFEKQSKTTSIEKGMAIFMAMNQPMDTQIKGMFSKTSKQRSHTSISSVFMREYEEVHGKMTDASGRLNWKKYYQSEADNFKKELAKQRNGQFTGGALRPIVNEDGRIVDLTVDMDFRIEEELLGLDMDVTSVAGAIEMRTVDKSNTELINVDGVEALSKRMNEHYEGNEHEFTNIMAVDTPAYNDMFLRLPRDARDKITKIADENKGQFMVESIWLDAIFGYEAWSIGDIKWGSTELIRSKQNKRYAKIFEEVVKEIVGVVNNAIVIKTPAVWGGNFVSNYISSVVSGVGAIETIKYWREGLSALREYQADAQELAKIDFQGGYDVAYAKASVKKRADIVRRMNRSSVKELMDEGLYSAITTQEMGGGEHTYKARLSQKLEGLADKGKVGPLGEIVKEAYIAEDTSAYRSLLGMVQVSDFVGRYGIYRDMVDNKGKSHDEAYAYIQDVFVDFQIPAGQVSQYLNSMGGVLFYKYWSRIQRATIGMIKHHPTRSMQLLIGGLVTGAGVSSIFNSGAVTGGNFAPTMGWLDPLNMAEEFLMPSMVEIGIGAGSVTGLAGLAAIGGAYSDDKRVRKLWDDMKDKMKDNEAQGFHGGSNEGL